MSIKYICNICKEEIILKSDDWTDMIIITVEGKRRKKWSGNRKDGSSFGDSEIIKCNSIFHIHEKKCFQKFLNLFEIGEIGY